MSSLDYSIVRLCQCSANLTSNSFCFTYYSLATVLFIQELNNSFVFRTTLLIYFPNSIIYSITYIFSITRLMPSKFEVNLPIYFYMWTMKVPKPSYSGPLPPLIIPFGYQNKLQTKFDTVFSVLFPSLCPTIERPSEITPQINKQYFAALLIDLQFLEEQMQQFILYLFCKIMKAQQRKTAAKIKNRYL